MIIRLLTISFALAAFALPASARPAIEHVFVIVMENKDAESSGYFAKNYVYGNSRESPYINGELLAGSARATDFTDLLPAEKSEPHYILMEAGTNDFADTGFHCDNDPDERCRHVKTPNWTKSPDHLTSQLTAKGLSWRAYVQSLDPRHTGACPVNSAGPYAAKHVPFVFFADIAGSPPSRDNAQCAAHVRSFDAFKADLGSGDVPNYVFITPDLCNDMHGARGCSKHTVRDGDRFLKALMPDLLDWSAKNRAIVMIAWDEGDDGLKIPFILAGAGVKKNHESRTGYDHRSMVKTIEEIFGLPLLPATKDATDFGDMFEAGAFP